MEGARAIGPELERHGLTGADPLGDPVIVDRQAVRDVGRSQFDLHEIVLVDLYATRFERVAMRAHTEQFGRGTLILRGEDGRSGGQGEQEVRDAEPHGGLIVRRTSLPFGLPPLLTTCWLPLPGAALSGSGESCRSGRY